VVTVWPGANGRARNFRPDGIRFNGHPDLRRILMPEDWEGYPLRKDYPVEGYRDIPSIATRYTRNGREFSLYRRSMIDTATAARRPWSLIWAAASSTHGVLRILLELDGET